MVLNDEPPGLLNSLKIILFIHFYIYYDNNDNVIMSLDNAPLHHYYPSEGQNQTRKACAKRSKLRKELFGWFHQQIVIFFLLTGMD